MKKILLAIVCLALFSVSVYLAFVQGGVQGVLGEQGAQVATWISPASSVVAKGGVSGMLATVFWSLMSGLLRIANHSVLWAIVLLALLVELVLLYPSVSLQLKQKKIHVFHRKVVDRFRRGELGISATREELHKVYDVNERIHRRGAWLVGIQVAVFLFTLWGLNLMAKVPSLFAGSWSVMNFSLFGTATGAAIPLLVSLIYFFHSMVKVYCKEREDFISGTQTALAIFFGVAGSTVVYYFSARFPIVLLIYFVTLVTFATIRYLVVEENAREWGRLAQSDLIKMLREAKPHRNRFQFLSRWWNHLPIIRHLNFNLLEEALSMALGLLLALSFFGAFQKNDVFYAANQPPGPITIMAEVLRP